MVCSLQNWGQPSASCVREYSPKCTSNLALTPQLFSSGRVPTKLATRSGKSHLEARVGESGWDFDPTDAGSGILPAAWSPPPPQGRPCLLLRERATDVERGAAAAGKHNDLGLLVCHQDNGTFVHPLEIELFIWHHSVLHSGAVMSQEGRD